MLGNYGRRQETRQVVNHTRNEPDDHPAHFTGLRRCRHNKYKESTWQFQIRLWDIHTGHVGHDRQGMSSFGFQFPQLRKNALSVTPFHENDGRVRHLSFKLVVELCGDLYGLHRATDRKAGHPPISTDCVCVELLQRLDS